MRAGVIMYQTSQTKGQELVAQRMVKEFRRQGHEAYLITSIYHDQEAVVSDGEVETRGGYLHSFDELLGIPVVRVRSHKENWPPRRITFVDFMSNLTRIVDDLKLDVLITHSTLWNGPEESAKFVEWRRNQSKVGAPLRPLVFCHMSHFQEPTDERYDLAERTFREAWNSTSLPVIMRMADFVLVTTPYEKDLMKKMGVDESKFVLFPGGIDSTVLELARPDFRGKHGLPDGAKLVSFLGTVEERKNVRTLLEVAKRLETRDDVHFVVAGRLEGEYGEETRVASVGIRNLTITGPVPEEDYPSLIRESYLNINMSRSEALGLAQLEFMYNGIPVVTSGVGGQSWIVRGGKSGVVLRGPEDIEGAALAISDLADNPKKRNKLGENSRKTASRYTMPELIHDLTKTISQQLVGREVGSEEIEPGEKLLEAWVKKGSKVAITTRRLIVDSAKGGNPAIIPLAEINLVRKRLKIPWRALAVGVLATVVLFVLAALDPPGAWSPEPWLPSWAASLPVGEVPALAFSLASVPAGIALLVVLFGSRRGFSVLYGHEKEVFVPAEFAKALRIADELTPQSLFTREEPR